MVSVSGLTLRRVSGASQDHNFYPLMTGRGSDGVSGFYGCKLVNPPHPHSPSKARERHKWIFSVLLFSAHISMKDNN